MLIYIKNLLQPPVNIALQHAFHIINHAMLIDNGFESYLLKLIMSCG